jgi:hypothetical protein
MFRCSQPLLQDGQNLRHIVFQQGINIQPKAGKYSTAKDAVIIGTQWNVLSLFEPEPLQLLVVDRPHDVFPNSVAAIAEIANHPFSLGSYGIPYYHEVYGTAERTNSAGDFSSHHREGRRQRPFGK